MLKVNSLDVVASHSLEEAFSKVSAKSLATLYLGTGGRNLSPQSLLLALRRIRHTVCGLTELIP